MAIYYKGVTEFFEVLSDKEKLRHIKENPLLIAYMKRPKRHLQKAAIELDPSCILFIDKPYKDLKFLALLLKGFKL
jgi:hypothetical protein